MVPEWVNTSRCRIFVDMHLPDWPEKGVATRFDPGRMAAQFAQAGADSVVFYAKCQYGNFYYDTQLGHKHRGLKEVNLFEEFATAAHARGLKVIAYYSVSWDVFTAFQHPEWLTLDKDGKVYVGRWPTLCVNSPYRNVVFAHLREIADRTSADGIWLDMAIIGEDRCYCDFCQARFRERFGTNIPRSKEEPMWLEFRKWRYEYVEEFLSECRAVVKSASRPIVVCNNYWGYPYMNASNGSRAAGALKHADYVTGEGYSEWSGTTSPSFFAKFLRSASRGKPFEVLLSRFHEAWDFTVRPFVQMAYESYAVAANGGTVTIDDEPYHDGTLELEVYDQLERIFKEIRRREVFIRGASPVKYAAIWHSQATKDILERGGGEEFIAPIVGTYKALIDAHIPVDFVFDEHVTEEDLLGYQVVILPATRCLSDEHAVLLKEYVKRGGAVVATGMVGTVSPSGEARRDSVLGDLLGIKIKEVSPYSVHYFKLTETNGFQELSRRPYLIRGKIPRVEPGSDARLEAVVVEPICENTDKTYYHNNLPAPYQETCYAAVVVNTYGGGRTLYFAMDPGEQYARLAQPEYRKLLVQAVLRIAREAPPFSAKCPMTTEVILNRQGEHRWIMHFLNAHLQQPVWYGELAAVTGFARRSTDVMEEVVPLYDVEVEVRAPVVRVELAPGGELLPITVNADGSCRFVIPKIDIWATVVLDLERRC